MQFKTRRRRVLALAAGAAVAGTIAMAGIAGAAGPSNPQLKPNSGDAAADRCVLQQQMGVAGMVSTKTYNAPTVETLTGLQLVKCTRQRVVVDQGETAGLDLLFSGEFDAQGASGNLGWWQTRFWVTPVGGGGTVSTVEPDNNGRSDSFAQDHAQGSNDWSAHVLHQDAVVFCPTSAPAAGCTFDVFVQGNLTNGATSVWYDDLTTQVTVTDATYWGRPVRSLVAP